MPPERWKRVKDVLSLALKRPSADRAALLDDACAGDPSLRREIGELLDCNDEMGSFLEQPLLGELADAPPEDRAPSELEGWDRYRVLERLGSGGMAVVYKAWDPRLQRPVAIKLISGRDEDTVRRFLREAEAQARVDHDNVLKVYETGVVGRHHYIAMQYVDGPTLLGVRAETTLEHKVELMLKVAEGLQEAHRRGLVHRDIKPTNILVEAGAQGLKPYVLDFGLAVELGGPALTKTGVVVGTPRYMAPERIRGGTATLDRRSDIYSLGAAFYELISGTAPFAGSSGLEVLAEILRGEFTPLRAVQPAVPRELDAIVMKCLETDPEHRYASARALADDLRRYLDGDPVLARPVGLVGRLAKKARRHPRLAAAFAALASLTLAAAAWGAYGYWRAAREAELAQQLGSEIRDIEWLYRAAQMSPLHAIDAQKLLVRERMSRLQQDMDQIGSLAFGPGHYALGRGSLTLGENSTALTHLQRAWESGYRTADAAAALGLAHSEVFRIELARAQRIAAVREREARIRELEVAHRDRALFFLDEGRSSSIVTPRYVEASIASLRGDLRGAIEKAEEAAREVPWLFEARLLQGHLELQEGVKLYFSGNVPKAAEKATQADRRYAEAQRIAGSSMDSYLGRCAVSGLMLHMAGHGLATDAADVYRQAEESCSRALVVESENARGYRLYSEAVAAWGTIQVQAKRDPRDVYLRAIDLANRAVELSSGDPESILALADAYSNHAWLEHRSGRDPRAAVDRAVATYAKALAVDPRNATGAHNMGQALVLRSRYEIAHRLDASDSLERCVSSFQQALRLDPDLAFSFRYLASESIARAAEQSRRGVDPAGGLEQVARFIEELPGDRSLAMRTEALAKLRLRLANQ